ncbi:MAG: hypothetical protein IT379_39390 [Deltaproteobacteria bacterium]|nr:hypothetical protein [Deltaproteobacteria bacterium]
MALAIRRYADPETLDFVLEHGAPKGDPTLATDVLRRIATRRGSIPTLTTFGSRLHTIRKLGRGVERQAAHYIREALADLVASRRIRDLASKATADRSRGALLVEASFRDRGGSTQTVRYTHRVR